MPRTAPQEPSLCADDQVARIRMQSLGDQPFRDFGTVGVGGIDEVHSQAERALQNRLRLTLIRRFAPHTRPCNAHGAKPKPLHREIVPQPDVTGGRRGHDRPFVVHRCSSARYGRSDLDPTHILGRAEPIPCAVGSRAPAVRGGNADGGENVAPMQQIPGGGERVADLSYAHGASLMPLLGETIGANLRRTAERAPDSEALVVRHQGYRATYRELWDQVGRAARGLLSRGVRKGDRVGIWAPNRYEWVVIQYATARIGATLVNINPAYKT